MNGGDPWIISFEVRINVTEQAAVTDAAVGTKRDPARRRIGLAPRHAVARVVNKTAFIFQIIRNPFLRVMAREVLAVLQEANGRGPIQIPGADRTVVPQVPRMVKSFQSLQGVP